MNHFILAAKLGIKTLYYANTKGLEEAKEEELTEPEQIDADEFDCDSCKI